MILVIKVTLEGQTVHLEKESSNRSAGISDPQIGELPF